VVLGMPWWVAVPLIRRLHLYGVLWEVICRAHVSAFNHFCLHSGGGGTIPWHRCLLFAGAIGVVRLWRRAWPAETCGYWCHMEERP